MTNLVFGILRNHLAFPEQRVYRIASFRNIDLHYGDFLDVIWPDCMFCCRRLDLGRLDRYTLQRPCVFVPYIRCRHPDFRSPDIRRNFLRTMHCNGSSCSRAVRSSADDEHGFKPKSPNVPCSWNGHCGQYLRFLLRVMGYGKRRVILYLNFFSWSL